MSFPGWLQKNRGCFSRSTTTGIFKRLQELEASNFIQSFLPYGRNKRDHFYRVIDEFSLFHLKWIEPILTAGVGIDAQGYWQNMVNTPAVTSWSGYAFENVCLKHTYQIRKALGIEKIACKAGRWHYIPKKGMQNQGAQIDLFFDREDGIITICEIKYANKPFIIDKDYGKQLIKKVEVLEQQVKPAKQIFLAMITTEGLKPNLWSEELVQNEVSLADLFA